MDRHVYIRQLRGHIGLFDEQIERISEKIAYGRIACELRSKRMYSTKKGSHENHYRNLNLGPNAKLREIKRSFKKLSMKLHPDKLQSQKLSEEDMERKKEDYLRIKRSYEVLCDPAARRAYDRTLAVEQARTAQQEAALRARGAPGYHYTRYGARNYERTPDFNRERYFKWNMANEQRMRERKITQCGDLFHHDLNNIDLSMGVRKDLRRFSRQSDEDARRREMRFLRRLALTVVGLMALWELTLGQAWDANGTNPAKNISKHKNNSNQERAYRQDGNNEYSSMIIANALGDGKGVTQKEQKIEFKGPKMDRVAKVGKD